MKETDKTTRIIMNRRTLEMIRDRGKEINKKPELREIEVVYFKCNHLSRGMCYSDGEVIDFIEIKSKCFYEKLFKHGVNGGKIMMRNDDDWLVLVKENNENN